MKRLLQIAFLFLSPILGLAAHATTITNLAVITNGPPVNGFDSITVVWTTDVPASSQLFYGINYIQQNTPVNATLVTSHSMTLNFLTQYVPYVYQAVSVDGSGNQATSATQTITTCAANTGTSNLTGTINNYYEYGTYTINWVNTSGISQSPTICGQTFTQSFSGFLDRGASFNIYVAPTTQIVPSPNAFNIVATGIDGSIGSFNLNFQTTGASTNISSQLATGARNQLIHVWYDPTTMVFYPPLSGGVTLAGDANGPAPSNTVNGLHFGSTAFTLSADTPPSSSLPVLGYISPGVLGGIAGGGGAVTKIIAGNNVTISPTTGVGNVTINASGGGGSGCGSGSNCVITNPTTNQIVTQPDGTNLQTNILNQNYYANQFGSGANGIESVYGNTSYCIPQAANTPWGCSIQVPPLYTNSDAPNGWLWGGNNYGGNYQATSMPAGSAAYDYRNGTAAYYFHDPINPVTGQSGGLIVRNDFDQNFLTRNTLGHGGGIGNPTGLMVSTNVYAGGWDFLDNDGYIPTPQAYQNYSYGLNWTQDNWSDGIDFGEQEIMNHHGLGDSVLEWKRLTVDGGIFAANSEGSELADDQVGEDTVVFTGTVSGSYSAGATEISTSATIGGGTQGQDRLLLDTQTAINGNYFTGYVGAQTTGSNPNSAQIASQVTDTAATFPVSTIVQLCYPGSDNGAGGAAGCTAGSQPIGYIPPQPSGSTTGFSPVSPITLNVVAPYTGTGGGTNGLPSGFCSTSNLQSSNPDGSCYMPPSGVGCLTDQVEDETVNYTYSSGAQTITITGMMFPHQNGAMFAVGGLCGYAVQDNANIVPSGLGTSGTIAPTYPVVGSLNSTTFYYATKRSNEGFGPALLGLSNPGNGNSGYGSQLYFSVGASNFSNTAGVVTFYLNNPPQVLGDLHAYNGLTLNFQTNGDASYNGNWQVTWVSGNIFSYTPTSPSGAVPTSGTVSFNNASYSIYPAARVASVYNPSSNNKVDGTFFLYPNTITFNNGDSVREPHYQQLNVVGRHDTIEQLSPEQYLGGSSESVTYSGIYQGIQAGFTITNTAAQNFYLGYGGTHVIPAQASQISGLWDTTLSVTNTPENDLLFIQNCKSIGCSKANSNFNVFEMPQLPNAQPGTNGIDVLNYDPNYQSSVRYQGLYSGLWKLGNNQYPAIEELGQQSFASLEAGYYISDQSVTSPTVNANNFFTSQLTSITVYPNAEGTTGSTTYNYWVVGHALANPSKAMTTPIAFSVPNGNATLNGTNYNLLCFPHQAGWYSFDILKGDTAHSIVTGLSAVTPNGGSVTPTQPANYSCFADQGGATTAYTAPTANTTGGATIAGPVEANGGLAVTGACTINGVACNTGGGSLPSASIGQILTNTNGSTTYAGQANIFYQQSGDTIASIETECASLCTYVITEPQVITLAASHKLSANVQPRFEADGSWTVNGSGYTLTIPGKVSGTLSQHFVSGTGSVTLGANNSLVPVEWFGATGNGTTDDTAAIQATINAITYGQIQLQCTSYLISTGLTITKGSVGVQGCITNRGPATITTVSASINILSVTGTSGTYVSSGVFQNFNLVRTVLPTGTATGFSCSFGGALTVDTVNSQDSVRDFYIHSCPSYGTGRWSNDNADYFLTGYTNANSVYGFYLDSADGYAENSLRISNSQTSNDTGTTAATFYGMILTGEAINDVMTNGFETSGVNYGQYVIYTGGGGSFATSDIQFTKSIHDNCRTSCYYISGTTQGTDGSVAISGGWVESGSSTSNLIDIENSYGVQVTGVQINQHTSFNATHAIYAYNSSGLVISNNNITNFGTSSTSSNSIEFNETNDSAITGNTINALSGAAGNIIWLTGTSGSSYNTVSGNSLNGYTSANGIYLNAGSNYNIGLSANSINTTNISNAIGDAGTGNGMLAVKAPNLTATTSVTTPVIIPGVLYSAAGTPLPACASGTNGERAVVTDATSPTFMGAYTSGGTITAEVICSYNGTAFSWLIH